MQSFKKQNKQMRLFVLLLILGSTCVSSLYAHQVDFFMLKNEIEVFSDNLELGQDNTMVQVNEPRFKKLKAALLAIFLGHFGVHRIYLGTDPSVPVVYSLTLGGGLGLLPLVDFIAIITAKDLDKYTNNNRVIMWVK